MQEIQTILNVQTKSSFSLLKTESVAVWISWANGPDAQMHKLFEEFGGVLVSQIATQSLWFFFNPEATFYAVARLDIWSKQSSNNVSAFVFPATLDVSTTHSLSIDLTPEYKTLNNEGFTSESFIFIHPEYFSFVTSLPGISFYEMVDLKKQGLIGWKRISADRRLPFNIEKGWFAFINPVGNLFDAGFTDCWDKFIFKVQNVIEANKFKAYIHGNFISVFIPTIVQLRIWVSEILNILDETNKFHQDIYWPCLTTVLDKGNINFSNNLHEIIDIDWASMMPDQVYLTYKNALMLGRDYKIRDLNFNAGRVDINDMCAVNLNSHVSQSGSSNLFAKILLPEDKNTCFYCGGSGHTPINCPTKMNKPVTENFWVNQNFLDFSHVEDLYKHLDNEVKKNGINGYFNILNSENLEGDFLRATFAITAYFQFPNIERIWSIASRNIDEFPENVTPQKTPALNILKRFSAENQDINSLERDCINNLATNPKSWQIKCLHGFVLMEKGDYKQAKRAWGEAENLCTTTLHQGWIKFLQARIEEIQGHYNDAIALYKKVNGLLPHWTEPNYRALVCQVKMGYGQRVANMFLKLVESNPEVMIKILLDPELFRGQVHILNVLQPVLDDTHAYFLTDRERLIQLLKKLEDWFYENDKPMMLYGNKIKNLLSYGIMNNYLLSMEVINFRPKVEKDLQRVINQEVDILKNDYEKCLKQVEIIRDEMNWFYFQRILIDFNNVFNDCAKILNWAFTSNFFDVTVYKEAREKLPELKKHVEKLRGKLTHLRMVRDISLFAVMFLRSFIKTSIYLCILSLLGIFGLLFFGSMIGLEWIQEIIQLNFWQILKVVLSITFMVSFGLSALKTTVVFDKNKNKLLKNARDERMKIQLDRIEEAKKKKEKVKKGK